MRFEFYFPRLWERSGVPVSVDVDNPIKCSVDAIARALGFDDKWVWRVSATKCWGPERIVARIEEFSEKVGPTPLTSLPD